MNKYNPEYYKRGKIEVLDFILDQKLHFIEGNVVKYIVRAGFKEGASRLEDLMKANEYIARAIAIETEKQCSNEQ